MLRPPETPNETDLLLVNYKADAALPYKMTLKDFQKIDPSENKNLALVTFSKSDFFDVGPNDPEQGIKQLAKDLVRDLSLNGGMQQALVTLKQEQNLTHEELKQPTRKLFMQHFNVDPSIVFSGYSQGPAGFIPFLLGSATGDKYKILQPQVRMNNLFYDEKAKNFYLDFYAESFPIDGETKGILPAKVKAQFVFAKKGFLQKDYGCELVSVATDSAEVYVMLKGHTYNNETFPRAFARYINPAKNAADSPPFATPSITVMKHYINLIELINSYKVYALSKLAKFKLSEEKIKELAANIEAKQEINYPLGQENINLCRKYAHADRYLQVLLANRPYEERFKRLREICQTSFPFMSQHRDNKLFSAKGSRLIIAILKELDALDIMMPTANQSALQR